MTCDYWRIQLPRKSKHQSMRFPPEDIRSISRICILMETPAYSCLLSATAFLVSRPPFPRYTSIDESNVLCYLLQISRTKHKLQTPPQRSLLPGTETVPDGRKRLSLRTSRAQRNSEKRLQEKRRILLNQRRLPEETPHVSIAFNFERSRQPIPPV